MDTFLMSNWLILSAPSMSFRQVNKANAFLQGNQSQLPQQPFTSVYSTVGFGSGGPQGGTNYPSLPGEVLP